MTAPTVLVTELPTGHTPGTLTPAHDPTLRVVHLLARPAMTKAASLAHDVLVGMGKSSDVTGGSHRDGRDISTRVAPWLLAHRTQWIVVFGAQDIRANLLPIGLLDAALAGGARVLLVAEPRQRAVVLDAVAGYGTTAPVDYREWAAQHDVVLGPAAPEQPEAAAGGFAWDTVELPQVGWPWFRARCRDQLPPEQFAEVDALYRHTLQTVRAQFQDYPRWVDQPRRLDPRPVVDILGPLLRDRYTRAEGALVLKAAQAALFSRGYLLRADVDTLLNLLVDGDRPTPLTDRQWRSLRAYQQAWRSAACAFAASGWSVKETTAVTMHDIESARTALLTSPSGDKHVDPRGWEYLMAQYYERLGEGAESDEPLFTATASMISRAVRDTRSDLGLRLGGYVPIKADRTPEQNWQELTSRKFLLTDLR